MKFQKILLSGLFAASLAITGCDGAAGDLLGGTRPEVEDSFDLGITPQPKGQKPLAGIDTNMPLGFTEGTNNKVDPNIGGGEAALEEPADFDDGSNLAAGEDAVNTPLAEEGEEEVQPSPQPSASTTPSPEPSAEPSQEPDPISTQTPEADRDFFFLSYDDSASTAGVELTKFALNNNFIPNPSWARPWEFLNYETFPKQGQENIGKFDVSMGLWKYNQAGHGADYYDLGVHISGPEMTKETRRNIHLTLTVDVSGSMNSPSALVSDVGFAPSLMDIAKTGLVALAESLKPGDTVSIVTFSNAAQILVEDLEVTSNLTEFMQAVESISPLSGTNLNAGVTTAYQVAQRHYDPAKINRVVMLTDAFANAGEVDPSVISQSTEINNAEGIYFSGLGFGQDFNEGFLNELTEAGRGAYYSVITETDATNAFQDRFMALINVAARDVQFKLEYPAALKHAGGAAEETSKVQTEVQPTNFSFNTSQYFWEQFNADGEINLVDQTIKLSIFYTDPNSFEKVTEVFEKPISELLGRDINNIKDARMVVMLTRLIKGEQSAEETQTELNTLLSDHASALASEYRRLIETYISLAN